MAGPGHHDLRSATGLPQILDGAGSDDSPVDPNRCSPETLCELQ
jgi:hypothetical protein